MPKFVNKRWYGFHGLFAVASLGVLTVILAFFQWYYGLLGLLFLLGVGLFSWYAEREFQTEMKQYLASLSHRVKLASENVVQQIPVGILLYDDDGMIQWHNPYMAQLAERQSLVGESVAHAFPSLAQWLFSDVKEGEVQLFRRHFAVQVREEEKVLFILEITQLVRARQRYEDEKPVLGIVHLDNLEEVSQGLDEQAYTLLLAQVSQTITDWANQNMIYIRRISTDKFFIAMEMKRLQEIEKNRFEILDVARELTQDQKIPITLSIGVGAEGGSLVANGKLASTSLDVALGRGGDQAAVKVGDKISFYGGKSNAVEKRTRVRVRVLSHAMKDMILESDVVLIMGHTLPDLDAMGAALGVLQAVQLNGKTGYIVMDGVNPAIERLMHLIDEIEGMNRYFVSAEQAMHLCQQRSLLVVVDTHRPTLTVEPRLFQLTRRVMVIDHHRRGEEMVEDPLLLCLEPYASSTCELVTELLQYQSEAIKMPTLVATALLAGIVVDTKGFIFQTGSRTFEAASYLRRMGADTALVQRLVKEDLSQFLRRIEMLKQTEMVFENIAIVTAPDQERFDSLLIAQTADNLLSLSGVIGSFAVARRMDDLVQISGRSMGELNVQVILEKLGGGGHLTNAAVQLKDVTTEEASQQLRAVLSELQPIQHAGGERG